jgi:hypothetical protein
MENFVLLPRSVGMPVGVPDVGEAVLLFGPAGVGSRVS